MKVIQPCEGPREVRVRGGGVESRSRVRYSLNGYRFAGS